MNIDRARHFFSSDIHNGTTRTKDICDGENSLRRLGKYLSDEKRIRRSLNS